MWLQSIIGISVVFLALIALFFCIYLFGKLMNRGSNKKSITETAGLALEEKSIIIEVDGDDELIAVITAAVSAYLTESGLIPSCKFKVTAFNRVENKKALWSEVNKNELVQNL